MSRRRHRFGRRALAVVTSVLMTLSVASAAEASPERQPAKAATPSATPTPLTAAQASLRARTTGHATVVDALTTPNSQTAANPDGSFTRTVTEVPTRVKRNGTWVALDPTLHVNSDGTLSPNATSGDVRLSGGGTGPLMVLSGGAHEVSLTLPMALPTPSFSGDTATYPAVLPSVDLVVTVDSQGSVSEVMVVKSPAAAQNPALRSLKLGINAQGLSVRNDDAGNITFTDPTGHAIYSAPSPLMWDSAPVPASVRTTVPPNGEPMDTATGLPTSSTPHFPSEQAHRARIGVATSPTAITLTPDSTMLGGTGMTYPVYIDPAITFIPDSYGAAADWTEVESGKANYAGWHQSGYEQVGDCDWDYCNGIGITRSYFQFGTGPLKGTTILGSQLNFTEEYSPTCTLPTGHNGTVDLFLTGGIGPGTNWSSKPGPIGGIIGQNSGMYGYDNNCRPAGVGFDVTNVLRSALGQTNGTITFGLQADNEADDFGWKEFNDTATWSTTYDVTPVTPFNPAPSPAIGCVTQKPYPIIGTTDLYLAIDTARASDGVAKPLNVDLRVLNSTGGVANDQTVQTTAGSWATSAIAKGTFATGDYTWSAQATDGALTSAWSPACGFHVDTSQPGTPVVIPTSPSGCTVQGCDLPVRTPITLSFTPASGSSTPAAYRYQINSGIPTTVTASNGTWTGTITPMRVGPNTVTVQALSAAGTPSALAARFNLTTQAPATPDADGDFTGDGHPDLLTVGNVNGASPGLWLSTGDGTGKLANPTDIGIRGNGLSTSNGAPSNWNGAVITHGQFWGDGMQDILAVFPPATTGGAQTTEIYRGTGDGSALNPVTGNINGLQGICFTDPDWNCLTGQETITQITAMGHLPEDQCAPACATAYPDLFAIVNNNGSDQLWWFQSADGLGNYDASVVLDSTTNWASKTISGTTYNGQPALEVYDVSSGEIDLYTTNTTTNAQNLDWFTDATKTVMRTAITGGGLLNAADANGDGQPDAWLTTAGGTVNFYPGSASGVLGNATSAGTTAFTDIPLIPFGSVSWNNPSTGSPEVDVYAADKSGNLWLNTETATGMLGPPTLAATGWTHYRSVGIADMNHDGYPDLVAIDTTTNNEDVFTGSATGLSTTSTVLGTGVTNGYTAWGIADWNHDGHYDILLSDLNGTLWEYPGDLTGGVGNRVQLSTGWTSAYTPFGVGDFTGDGHNDLLVCNNNNLVLYLGDGTGGQGGSLAQVTTVASGCGHYTSFGVADYNNNGHADIVIRDNDTLEMVVDPGPGALGTYAGDGEIISPATASLTPFGAVTWTPPSANAVRVDVYAADTGGTLWDYTENSAGVLGAPSVVATGWTHYRSVGIADMNHDGYPDLVAIDTTTNNEDVFTGSATGFSATPVVLGVGWTSGFTPYGIADWNHDGHYDTIAADSSGTMWEYPGDLTGGVASRVQISTGWTSNYFTPYGIADFTGDGHSDILTCRSDIDSSLIYPGDGTGGSTGSVDMALTDCNGGTFFGATDYNNDGNPDVIVRDNTTGNIIVVPNKYQGALHVGSQVIASGW